MRLLYPYVFIYSLNFIEKIKLLETLKTIFSILVLMIAWIFPNDSIDVCKTTIIESSDKILNAGWIDFILRPVFEQEVLDRLEGGIKRTVDDGGLDILVGGDVCHQSVQVTTEQEKLNVGI